MSWKFWHKARSFDEIIQDLDDQVGGATRSAMQQATVYACVRILSESIAQLPIELLRRDGRTVTKVEDHPVLRLLSEPNGWQTPHEFWQFNVTNNELRGNHYAFKTNVRSEVRELIPLRAESVNISLLGGQKQFNVSDSDTGISGTFGADEIYHGRNLGTNIYEGISTIGYAAAFAIDLALDMETHGSNIFKNGAQPAMSLEVPGELSDNAFKRLKRSIRKKYEGAQNAGKTLVLEGGAKATKLAMTSEDAQYLESRKFQKQEIASIFGVPLFLINETEKSTTWGSGLEQVSKGFLRYTLAPRLSRICQTLKRELLTPDERINHFFRFNTDEFSLGDFKERMEGYAKSIEAGILNPNEVREREGMNPREGGDEYRIPLNTAAENDQGQDDETEVQPTED